MLACKRMKGRHTALVHKSTIATDKLEEERRLLTTNTTRWYSSYYCVKSVLRLPKEKFDSMQLPTKLTALDRNILSDWLNVMETFVDTSTTLQADRKVTSSQVILAIHNSTGLTRSVNSLPAWWWR